MEGIGDAFVQTAAYSLISLKFPENREKFIGLGEAFSGVGLMAGPGIAGILYTYLGYFQAFFGFVIFIALSAIFCQVFIPQSMNGKFREEDDEDETNSSDREAQDTISNANPLKNIDYFTFLKDRRTLFGVVTCTFCCFLF
jgi:MFS family permease